MLFQRLKNFFKKIEEDNRPIIFYIGSFISILIIRNFLEVIAYEESISLVKFLHYSLFWVYLVLLLVLVINITTNNKLQRIVKVLTYIFPVILLPPLIDTIFYGRDGFDITYLLPQHFEASSVFSRFINFTGNFNGVGVSLGMKIEIFLILLFVFLYIYFSERKILKSIGVTFLTYCLLFFSLSLPTLVEYYLNFLNIKVTHLVISQILLILIFVFIICLVYKHKKKLIINFIQEFDGLNFLAHILIFNSGFWIAATRKQLVVNEVLFSYIFFILTIFAFNLLSGHLKQLNEKKFDTYSILIFITCLVFGGFGGGVVFFLFLVFFGLYFLFNFPLFELKNIPFLSKLVLSFQFLILLTLGYSLVAGIF